MAPHRKPTARASQPRKRPQKGTQTRGRRADIRKVAKWTRDETICLLAHLDYWIKHEHREDSTSRAAHKYLSCYTKLKYSKYQIVNRMNCLTKSIGRISSELVHGGSSILTNIDKKMKEDIRITLKQLESSFTPPSSSGCGQSTDEGDIDAVGDQDETPAIQKPDDTDRERILSHRERDLDSRESLCSRREKHVREKEAVARLREKNVQERETTIDLRERSFHQREIALRHKEEDVHGRMQAEVDFFQDR